MFLSSVTSYKQQLWLGRALLIMGDTKLRTRWRNQKVQLEELQRKLRRILQETEIGRAYNDKSFLPLVYYESVI